MVDFESAYNGILGRPALAKFLIATHYGYQSLKMPRPKGVITVRGDQKMAYVCDRKSLELVDELPTREANPSTVQVMHSRPKMTPKPSDQTKEVPLDKGASPDSAKSPPGSGNADSSTRKILVRARLNPK